MTPLGLVPQAPSTAAANTPPRAPAGAPGKSDFARALERQQPVSADRPRMPVDADVAAQAAVAGEPDSTATPAVDPKDHDASAEATFLVDPQHAAPLPWPPGGLAALLGFADIAGTDAATVPAPVDDGAPPGVGATLPAAPASGRPLPTVATTPASAPSPLPGLDMPVLDDDAAAPSLPVADLQPQVVDDAQAPPPTFALPPVAAATPPRAPVPMLAAPLPPADVQAEDFGDRFGAQLQWMAGQKIGHARIQVTPHDLGPVEVRLRLDGERISAEFFSAHVETRQALEQGLPRLRDLLGEHGFQLAHADVGAQAEGRAQEGAARSPSGDGSPEPRDDRPLPATGARRIVSGLLDAYA